MIDGKTKVCCLIGDPVEHSLSPVMHNSTFEKLGLNFVYVAFRVERTRLENFVKGMKTMNILGANVTIPHKIEVMRFLNRVDPLAQKIGAVNTIANDDGILTGYNTDGLGSLRALKGVTNPEGKKVVLIGAGGAARAIGFTLAELCELRILNRTEGKAGELENEIQRKTEGDVKGVLLSRENLREELRNADILINSTSVGMRPNTKETVVPRDLLQEKLLVFDIVYNPIETRLLKEAKEVGCKTLDGLYMLVYQGAEAFKIWTGENPDVDIMRETAMKILK